MMIIMLILMSMILISRLMCLCIVDDNYDAYCHKLMIRTVSFIPMLFMILMPFLDVDDEMMMMMMNYHLKKLSFFRGGNNRVRSTVCDCLDYGLQSKRERNTLSTRNRLYVYHGKVW